MAPPGFRLRHLAFHGPNRPPATVKFGAGLNRDLWRFRNREILRGRSDRFHAGRKTAASRYSSACRV